ncbi:MAG: hypothetical protein J5605_07965 [Bacteroidales bacterium]|nr:hypothetical protein [Bacteroidales bacterium]
MNWTAIIVFLVIGAVLIALELVALPGGIAGIVGAVAMIIAIWQCYAQYGTLAGNIVLIISVIVVAVLLVLLMRNKTWRKVGLKEEISGKVNEIDSNKIALGATGTTISRLAPAGKALINGQTCEVHTVSEFIDENKPVEVIKIDGYHIIVKEIYK